MESNHHSQWPRGYSALSSPVLSIRKMNVGGGICFPQPARSVARALPAPSVACRHACQPPPWTARGMPAPLATPDARYGPRSAERQPLFRHSLGLPVGCPILSSSAGGTRPTSRAHEAREEAAPPPRDETGLAGWSRTSDLRFPKPAGWTNCPTARGGCPGTRHWRCPGSRRPWNRTTLHRRIDDTAQPARRRCLPAQIGDPLARSSDRAHP